MHVAFKFHYIHSNGLFIRLLKRIRERSPLPLTLYQEKQKYVIEASGSQKELEALANLVSLLIPKSLFLQEHTLGEIETLHESQLLEDDANYKIPYCPECQQYVRETLNPFESCSVCGFSDTILTLDELITYMHSDATSAPALFTQLADSLIKNKTIALPTYNGIRRFSLLNAGEDEESGLLICNPADISDSLMITQGELDSLMMIEKPSVRLKPKLKFRAENGLHKPFYHVFFPDDKITLALTTALADKGVFALYCDEVPPLRVASALGQHVIIHIGRDILPWHHPMAFKQASCCRFEGFEAFGGKDGLLLTTANESVRKGCIEFVANDVLSPKSAATIFFEPAHAALRCVVLENGLQGKSLCGIYLSHRHPLQIFGFSPKIGYLPMVNFSHNALNDPKTMLASIAQMDEAGARLVANYKTSFPKLYERLESACFESHGNVSMLSRLWAMAALFIGISDGDHVETACEQLEATALEFNGKSGPRIDYKVLKSHSGYEIDPRLAIRSAMSFKLAGVDEYLLSFGFIDSLADFIAQQAELADANIAIEGVTLSGSLFENRQLLMRTYNAIASNYKVFRTEHLGMDGANIAVGAVTLGSE